MGLGALTLSWRLPVVIASIGALLLAGFAAGMAVRGAMANGNDGVIYACAGDRSGAVRLVDSADDCNRGETAVHWNVQGPPGSPGALAGFNEQTNVTTYTQVSSETLFELRLTCSQSTQRVVWAWLGSSETADLDDIPLETTTSQRVEQGWGLELYYPAGGPTVQNLEITVHYWCIDTA